MTAPAAFDEDKLVAGAVGQTALDDDDGVAYAPVNTTAFAGAGAGAAGAGAGAAGAGAGAAPASFSGGGSVMLDAYNVPAAPVRAFAPGDRVLVFREVLPPWEPLLPVPLDASTSTGAAAAPAAPSTAAAAAAAADDDYDDLLGSSAAAKTATTTASGVSAASAASASASASGSASAAGAGSSSPSSSTLAANPPNATTPLLPKLYVPGPRPPRVPEYERRRGVVSAVQDLSQPGMVRVDVARENSLKRASDTVLIPAASLSAWQDYAVGSAVNVAPLAVLGRVVHADAQEGWLGVLVPMSVAEVASTASTRQRRCSEEDVALLRESVDPPAPPPRGSSESAVPVWPGAKADVLGGTAGCLDGVATPACYGVPSIVVSTDGKLFGRPCVPSTLLAGGMRAVIFVRIARALEWDFGAHNPKGIAVELSANPRIKTALRAFTVSPGLVPCCGQYPVAELRMHFALRAEPDIDTEFYDQYYATAGGKAGGVRTAWRQKKSSASSSPAFGGSGGGASGGGFTGGGDGDDGAGRAIWCVLGFVFGIWAILVSCVAKQSKNRQSAAWIGCCINTACCVAVLVAVIIAAANGQIVLNSILSR